MFRKYEKLILLPAVIQLLYFGAWYVICFVNPEFIDNNLVLYEFIEYTDESLAALFCGWVLYVSYNKVSRYQDNLLNNYAAIEGKNLGWLKNIIICFFALWVIWTVTHALRIIQGEDKSMYIVWLGMAGIVYWLGYFMFLRREFFEIPTFKSDKESKSGNILSEKTEEHYERLLELMTKDKLYMDSELNMSTLAEKTELSNGYLSQIINQKTGKNFFDFVNSYRVEDVKAKLKDPDFDHYSILAIGLEAGFKSKSTFNAVFKRLTGVTPSAFKKSM